MPAVALGHDVVGRSCGSPFGDQLSHDQLAVYAAVSGDTIKVAPGTYNEGVAIDAPLSNLTILGGQAHLRGESGPSIVTGTL